MKLRQIVYTSQSNMPADKRSLLDLLHDARDFNSADNITGILIHSRNYFIQVIEGEPEAIADLVSRLFNDTRHKDIRIVSDTTIQQRLFPQWSMGCADFDDPALANFPGVNEDFSQPEKVDALVKRMISNPQEWLELLDS